MPLTATGRKVLRSMQKQYGKEKGTRIFYATANTHRGWHGESQRHRNAALKVTKRKIRDFMKDEKKGVKEYGKAGLYSLAKDEARHYKFLKKLKGGRT